MAQLELLWVAAALMLLGAAVSLCVKCQLSGKALPARFGVLPRPRSGLGGSHQPDPFLSGCPLRVGSVLLSHASAWEDWPSWGCSGRVSLRIAGEGALLEAREKLGEKDPPTWQHPLPGVGATPWAADPSPWALWWVALGHPMQEEHLWMHGSCRGSGADRQEEGRL